MALLGLGLGERTRQSTNVLTRLPASLAFLAVCVSGVPLAVSGQDRYRVLQDENFRRDPGPTARLLATVRGGSVVDGSRTRSGWVEITLDGWIWAASVRRNADDELDYAVSAANGENLRTGPNGTVIARLGPGFLLEGREREGEWMRVVRTGWMYGRSLERVTADPAPAASETGPTPAPPTPQATAVPPGTIRPEAYTVTDADAPISLTAGGDSVGVVGESTPVQVLERSGEWVRVRVEGWVHEGTIRPASPDILVGVSGAEVRARPQDFEGKVVQWTIELISLRVADDLRRELPSGERYLLGRGPVPEAGFLYIIVTDEQARALDNLPPLAQLIVNARVRVSRSRYLGNTVLELLEYSVRNP